MPYVSKKKLDEVLRFGEQLSNIAFNLKQQDYIPEQHRRSMAETQRQWDEARKQLALEVVARKEARRAAE